MSQNVLQRIDSRPNDCPIPAEQLIEDAAELIRRYGDALRKIEALGHGAGSGFGFSCAEIAAEALGIPMRRRHRQANLS